MDAARRGDRWTQAEEDNLLRMLFDQEAPEVIAAAHQRSVVSILLRAEELVGGPADLPDNQAVFDWARDELRKGRAGSLASLLERITSAAAGWTPPPPRSQPGGPSRQRQRQAPSAGQPEVVSLWSSITGLAPDRLTSGPELPVLARHDATLLETVGTRLFRHHGKLELSDWVLDCDWLDVERLNLTAEQIDGESDEVPWIGAELVRAALVKVPTDDREILLRRLGLDGETVTLTSIGEVFGVTGERIRQRQVRGLRKVAITSSPGDVFRSWDHVHGVLRKALCGGDGLLDARLVLQFIESVVPAAPRQPALRLVAGLCGFSPDHVADIGLQIQAVEAEHERERAERQRAERVQGKLNDNLAKVVAGASWPAGTPAAAFPVDGPQRLPREPDDRSNSGYVDSARLGRRVGYDSDAELAMITLAEEADLVTTYCEQPLVIPYELDGRACRYYPDLMVELADGRRLVIEVKSRNTELAEYRNIRKIVAATGFCHRRGWGFTAVDSYFHTAADLIERDVDLTQASLVRARLEAGPLDWPSLRALLLHHGITRADLATMIVRNGWCLYTRPYVLSARPLADSRRWHPETSSGSTEDGPTGSR
ncbi:TnsA endonuclease N-terminal domain-containing protein [Amycolatopsis sp. NBC_01307]|uniref:TnsA endonuclease N-terminal domain-containing protein n=1 Tax=Amycolatopsis sp. NBC_01307 TaxID=2903561 RepID=UPI002E1184E5|nr:TnsA endonuclease N-terminal domain-containing protein [Amycolatopsis sp. NBC_01307]